MPRMSTLFIPVVAAAFLLPGCLQSAKDNRAADTAAIKAADIAWSKTAEMNEKDRMISFFLDDALFLSPNEPMATGKEGIDKSLSAMFALPNFKLKWTPTDAEASLSGELGYTVGTYEFSMTDPAGNPVQDHGKYVTIWKKQGDGTWKVAVDVYNSDVPLPLPAK